MLRHAKHLLLFMVLSFGLPAAHGTEIDDAAALQGVEQGKGVFLIDFTDARKLAFYLDIIKGTHAGFERQGVKPDLVLVFIGPTVKFLTTQPDPDTAQQYGDVLLEIETLVDDLARLEVRMEVCAVATRVFGVGNDTLMPGLDLTADGFVALIGYQTQGYKLVPLF